MVRAAASALSFAMAISLTSCVSAIPIVRDADMVLSGAVGGHLYPPQAYTADRDWLEERVIIKRVPGHQVGRLCSLYGNYMDHFVAECVRKLPNGSILVVLPTCPEFSRFYCEVAEQHAWGHVFQAKTGLEMNHLGWGRFNAPVLVADSRSAVEENDTST